ncbi:hypothetical protein CDAR_393261 [Caerostris darwini]|uniref:Uncharacterized protein n=1 Tax=Caerostris darwini TaxID=1538125 RepID=A0AAV4V0I2_9ARAC|nr:hypothetical protein CDAR_393261 [Caerostris darwini]
MSGALSTAISIAASLPSKTPPANPPIMRRRTLKGKKLGGTEELFNLNSFENLRLPNIPHCYISSVEILQGQLKQVMRFNYCVASNNGPDSCAIAQSESMIYDLRFV